MLTWWYSFVLCVHYNGRNCIVNQSFIIPLLLSYNTGIFFFIRSDQKNYHFKNAINLGPVDNNHNERRKKWWQKELYFSKVIMLLSLKGLPLHLHHPSLNTECFCLTFKKLSHLKLVYYVQWQTAPNIKLPHDSNVS